MTSIVSILTTFYNAIKTKFAMKEDVKQPDYNQNDSTAADYIKNRPFCTEALNVNITWDGNATGLTASSRNNYYKVSDLVFTLEQFEAMTFTDNSGSEYLIGSGFIINGNNVLSYGDMGPVIATIDNAGGIPGGWSDIFPEAGVYFPASGWVVSLKGTAENIVKLDNKFLDLSDYSTKTDLSDKMDKSNPTGTGSFSLNRKADTTVGDYSFAEGYNNEASGNYSHAEGFETTASSDYSHAEGMGTIAASFNQHIQGTYNIVDAAYADIIGNGVGDPYRSNAATVDWSGNAWYAGDVYVGSTSGTNKDEGSKKLATEEYVDSKQVQPDWNQNDSTAADYVKNRPFYTGDPVETAIVEDSTVTFSDGGEGVYFAEFLSSTIEVAVGDTYIVNWDGTDYECTGVYFNGNTFIGNLSIAGAGSDTGEPFLMLVFNGNGTQIFTLDTSVSHTFSIGKFAQEVMQIDRKYLPESAFTLAEWAKISNKIVDYKQQSLSLSVSGESITIGVGKTYSTNKINDNLKFEDGMVYEINGSITLYNPNGNMPVLNINGYYACSGRKILFGSCYDNFYKENIEVGLFTSDDMYNSGKLYAFASFREAATFTFDINITVTGEAMQLPDICIGENIQRVGDDIILLSSTANSTKKFKITVDDTGTISATEVS